MPAYPASQGIDGRTGRWVVAPLRNRQFLSPYELNAAIVVETANVHARPL